MNDTVYGVSPSLDYIKYTVSNDWNALRSIHLVAPYDKTGNEIFFPA